MDSYPTHYVAIPEDLRAPIQEMLYHKTTGVFAGLKRGTMSEVVALRDLENVHRIQLDLLEDRLNDIYAPLLFNWLVVAARCLAEEYSESTDPEEWAVFDKVRDDYVKMNEYLHPIWAELELRTVK